MHENFDLQNYLTEGVERVVSEAIKATLNNDTAGMIRPAVSFFFS